MSWDQTRTKVQQAQLRYAAQRLGQLQDKLGSQGQITKADIATLLRQGNLLLARAKAQNVIKEEVRSDLLQVLEMYLGVILEHFSELEKSGNPTPILVEAASSIIYAASQADIKELHTIRDFLVQHLGPDFARAAAGNLAHYVSPRVTRALSAPPPSATRLDDYLSIIAAVHGVDWSPDLRPHEKLTALSEVLDPQTSPVVDLPKLRTLCTHGLPNQPSWLRPRVWRILLGLLPVVKNAWNEDARKQREAYYDLVRRLLGPFADSPPPSMPFSPLDATLVDVAKQLHRVPPGLYSQLEDEPESPSSCPLNENAPDNIRIICAGNLDLRLKIINGESASESDPNSTPEIRLECDDNDNPEITPASTGSFSSRRPNAPATLQLHPSGTSGLGATHRKHSLALHRLLYIHSCLNPANHSPHMASLLVPLYAVLNMEVEPEELAHVEADTFWLFEAVIGEFSELEDEEGGNIWMKKFGERLAWADPELAVDLQSKGLDPALPHYSYRWLAPLLTHTLPLSSVCMTWDMLFSRPMRERDTNSKLDSLLDICTGMLMRARAPLFRLGKPGQKSPGLWAEENIVLPPPSPLRAWELSDAFLEGMSVLQSYPVEAAGGIESVLQTASDLTSRREIELKAFQNDDSSLSARLRDTMWRGFTNQISSTPSSPSLPAVDSDGEDEGETASLYDKENTTDPAPQSGFTSRLRSTVWGGAKIQSVTKAPSTNFSRIDVPCTPALQAQSMSPMPPSPLLLVSRGDTPEPSVTTINLWSYAEKLRDSDAAAKLAKASTNWKVKALEAWSSRSGVVLGSSLTSTPSQAAVEREDPKHENSVARDTSYRFPVIHAPTAYLPPERPAFFHDPRDSLSVDPRRETLSSRPPSPDLSPLSETGSTASSGSRTQRGGPKPLLLNSETLMSSTTPTRERTPFDVIRRPAMHRDSVSSVSSMSPTDRRTFRKTESRDWDSETARSRIVPLKRGTMPTPMKMHSRPPSGSSVASSDKSYPQNTTGRLSEELNLVQNVDADRLPSPDSPTTLPSSPLPKTPRTSTSLVNQVVRVSSVERQRGSVVLSELNEDSTIATQPFIRKKTPSPTPVNRKEENASDSSAEPPLRSILKRPLPRIRLRDKTVINDHLTLSPNSLGIPTHELDSLSTPRASSFEVAFPSSVSPKLAAKRLRDTSGVSGEAPTRKLSGEGRDTRTRTLSSDGSGDSCTHKASNENKETRPRKISEVRIRKISNESRSPRRNRDSSAEGDDEGYDDLLSAYESEEGHTE